MDGTLLWRSLCWLALLFLGFSLGIFAAWIGAKRSGTGESLRDILGLTAAFIRYTAIKMASNVTSAMAISVLGLCGLSFFAGYSFRGDRENRQRYTYTDVLILARHDPKTYDVRPARMEAWQAGLCEDNDWQPWQKLRRFSFQVRKNAQGEICLDALEGGYEFYTQNGKRILYPQENLTDARY